MDLVSLLVMFPRWTDISEADMRDDEGCRSCPRALSPKQHVADPPTDMSVCLYLEQAWAFTDSVVEHLYR